MAKSSWTVAAQAISKTMRGDLVELYESIPKPSSVGEWSDDGNLVSLGQYRANVTTPTEQIEEAISGTLRTHLYQITLDPDVALPRENKIFVKLIRVRQGDAGKMLEVTDISGGLLGQTLSASDERN